VAFWTFDGFSGLFDGREGAATETGVMTNTDTGSFCNLLARTRLSILRLATAFTAILALTFVALAPAASAHTRIHPKAYAARGCANANTPITAASTPQLQNAVVCLINIQRQTHGLPALKSNQRLDRSAQAWTTDMVNHTNFSHGADFSARISAVGFDWSNAAENIATGFSTPTSVVNGWMASTGHCQNILSPVYREVGTGISHRAVTGSANTGGTWTQDFALQMGQHPASNNWGPANSCA
jgi:uncharacterized protein YkwD